LDFSDLINSFAGLKVRKIYFFWALNLWLKINQFKIIINVYLLFVCAYLKTPPPPEISSSKEKQGAPRIFLAPDPANANGGPV
jgi:hypothetical protein